MALRDAPIKRKLIIIVLVISSVVLLLTGVAFSTFQVISHRENALHKLRTLGEITAANSTAALAFQNRRDAREILGALRADPDVVAACLYDANGEVFSVYPTASSPDRFPVVPAADGYHLSLTQVTGYEAVIEGADRRLGTLYLAYDLAAVYRQLASYGLIALLIMGVSLLIAYILARTLHRQISQPILRLAELAKAVSERGDYSVRATKTGGDEVGLLTDAFNHMLSQIQEQDHDLNESEERHRQIIAHVKDYSITMLDPEGNVITWNAGAERINGYAEEEIVGRHFSALYPDEGTARDALDVAVDQGRVELEGSRLRKDDSCFWANTVLTALWNDSGSLRGFSEVTRDITERKDAEQAIRTLNQELERRVEERTAELVASNKELESFSYSVSHDLRAPLRHIHGYLELLSRHGRETLNDKCRRYIGIATTSVSEMGQLIDDLLGFSRMGRVEMCQSDVDLGPLVDDCITAGEMETADRDIVWSQGKLPIVRGDPALLKQVLVNLISNAVKYTRGRQPARIEIGCVREKEGEVTLYVRDNGVGFDMDYVDKLFNVFQRLHGSEEFEGTGIGLANVRRIIERHGGRVWAEAALDVGATFYFTIPTC